MADCFIVMGVTCSGKSTLGNALAVHLGLSFHDGDDYHPAKNIDKMSKGFPLTDEDRKPWLQRLNDLLRENAEEGIVIACSALKEAYRKILDPHNDFHFVYLEASRDLIVARMEARKDHFMPPGLVESQFDALEEPFDVIRVDASLKTDQLVQEICRSIAKNSPLE